MGERPSRPTMPRRVRTDPEADLSQGVVVEANLLARVFGLRLLRVTGTIVLAPARPVDDAQAVVHRGARRSSSRRLRDPEDRPGARLATVARQLDHNARRLALGADGSTEVGPH